MIIKWVSALYVGPEGMEPWDRICYPVAMISRSLRDVAEVGGCVRGRHDERFSDPIGSASGATPSTQEVEHGLDP